MKSIRGMVILGFLMMMAFIVGQYFLVDRYQDRARDLVSHAIRQNYAASSQLSELAITGQAIRRYEKEYFIYHDDREGRAKYTKEWEQTFAKLQSQLAGMSRNAGGIFARDDVAEFSVWTGHLSFYGNEMRRIMADVEQRFGQGGSSASGGATREVNAQMKEGKDRFAVLLNGALKLEKRKAAEASQSAAEISANFDDLQKMLLWVVGAGVVLVVFLLATLPRAITRPISSLVGAAESMSKGNLGEKIPSGGISEFSTLEEALERMRITQLAMIERLKRKS